TELFATSRVVVIQVSSVAVKLVHWRASGDRAARDKQQQQSPVSPESPGLWTGPAVALSILDSRLDLDLRAEVRPSVVRARDKARARVEIHGLFGLFPRVFLQDLHI
ncbi:hypothetical protein RRG08_004699, partial [Elysia crispata]